MSDKLIVAILCGECPAKPRRVMARLYDTPRGVALRTNYRRPPSNRRPGSPPIDESFDDLIHNPANWRNGYVVGCPKHSWIGITIDWLDALVARYRTAGRVVYEVVEHPPRE